MDGMAGSLVIGVGSSVMGVGSPGSPVAVEEGIAWAWPLVEEGCTRKWKPGQGGAGAVGNRSAARLAVAAVADIGKSRSQEPEVGNPVMLARAEVGADGNRGSMMAAAAAVGNPGLPEVVEALAVESCPCVVASASELVEQAEVPLRAPVVGSCLG